MHYLWAYYPTFNPPLLYMRALTPSRKTQASNPPVTRTYTRMPYHAPTHWQGFWRSTAPQHFVCRVLRSLHITPLQMSIIEVFICRGLHMDTSMIPVCIWLICRLCTALHTKCCGAVKGVLMGRHGIMY